MNKYSLRDAPTKVSDDLTVGMTFRLPIVFGGYGEFTVQSISDGEATLVSRKDTLANKRGQTAFLIKREDGWYDSHFRGRVELLDGSCT